MDTSTPNITNIAARLQQSKDRVLLSNPFFGVLALAMKYASSPKEEVASTDGFTIYFNPYFLQNCSEKELDIVLLHELMHVALKHPFRNATFLKDPLYHLACDIVVNSNIISASPTKAEIIVNGKKLPHLCPDGSEGCEHSSLEVYEMLIGKKVSRKKQEESDNYYDPNDDFSVTSSKNPDEAGLGNRNIPRGEPVFEYYSTKSGIHYFRECSFDPLDDYCLPTLKDPMVLTYEKFLACNGHQHHVEMKMLTSLDNMPVPLFASAFPLKKGSDCDTVSVKKGKSLSFSFITFPLSQMNFHGVETMKVENGVKQSIRDAYTLYVQGHYIAFPSKELEDYFKDLAKKLAFKGPDIPFLCLNYIRSAAIYDLNFPNNDSGKDDIIFFLEDSKRGICVHFALALQYLLMAYGYPSRAVGGYRAQGGPAQTKVVVYEQAGHAWTETYLEKIGWINLDATPASPNPKGGSGDDGDGMDSHARWDPESLSNDALMERCGEIDARILDGDDMVRDSGRGTVPGSAQCIVKELRSPTIDWREYLAGFVQENVVDYTFAPPDNRFSGCDFMLPSFSVKDEQVKDVLFMVDTSGSMSDSDLVDCASEIAGAIAQFNGAIQGKIGFFDATVQGLTPFDGETDVKSLRIPGRGGTSFRCIFDYVKRHMMDNLPSSIIILTDGDAPYPSQKDTLDIPVLWVMTNNQFTPPFGNVARLHPKKTDR